MHRFVMYVIPCFCFLVPLLQVIAYRGCFRGYATVHDGSLETASRLAVAEVLLLSFLRTSMVQHASSLTRTFAFLCDGVSLRSLLPRVAQLHLYW